MHHHLAIRPPRIPFSISVGMHGDVVMQLCILSLLWPAVFWKSLMMERTGGWLAGCSDLEDSNMMKVI